MIGWMEGISLFYLILAALFAFAAGSTGLLRFSEWRHRIQVADKLVFRTIRVHQSINAKTTRFGLELQSLADFPIDCEIHEITTRFMDRFPPKKPLSGRKIIVSPQSKGWFDDHPIQIDAPQSSVRQGVMKCRLRYGKKGNLKNELKANKTITVTFTEHAAIGNVQWGDSHEADA